MQLTPAGLILLLLAAPVLLASAYVPGAAPAALAWMLAVVGVAVADALLCRRAARFDLERVVEDRLSLGAENAVQLRLRNRGPRRLRLLVKDDPPVAFNTPERSRMLEVAPYAQAAEGYVTVPLQRGDFTFGSLHVRGSGGLKLSTWQRSFPASRDVRVYPNLLEIRRYDLLMRRDRLQESGFRPAARRGEGTQFESLRDYVPDDDYADIDWKATARRGRPISREYEAERSQNVMLMLDAGRMMTAQVEGMTRLDHAINAALMLGHVVCTGDDAVGMIAFGREVTTFVPPRKGGGQVGRLLDQLYTLQPTLDEPDYAGAFTTLARRCRKRSLVVIFTDLVDADASSRLLAHVAALRPRHLPLLVTIRDTDLEGAAEQFPADLEQVYSRAMAGDVLADRERALAGMRSRGVLVVDVPPGKLTMAAVNEYLRVKATGRL